MEPQPSKEEILFNWFLADSREVVNSLTAASEQAAQVLASINAASSELAAGVDSAKAEQIAAHRDLMAVLQEVSVQNRQALGALDAKANRLLARTQQRTIWIASLTAILGGMLGGGFAAWLIHNWPR